MARLNASDKLEALRKRQKEIENQIKVAEARNRETSRKEDTRRKVVAGAVALEHLARFPKSAFAREFVEAMSKAVEPRNRPLFDFLPPAGGAKPAAELNGSKTPGSGDQSAALHE